MTKAKNILFLGINHESFLSGQARESNGELLPGVFETEGSSSVRPDLIVCVDVNNESLRRTRKWHKSGVPTVLISTEPRVVVPSNYSKRNLSTFDKVLEVGRPKVDPLLPWPQNSFNNPAPSPKFNNGKAIIIQSRKYSFVRGQLYGLRVQLAAKDNRVFVVGHSWEENSFRTLGRLVIEFLKAVRAFAPLDLTTILTGFQRPLNLLGPAENKVTAMSNFKAAVVIENSQEYMSEKFFDALVGGCIPVYVGPDLSSFGIPPDLFVKADPSLEAVRLGITQALNFEYDSWQTKVRTFLSDEKTLQTWGFSIALRRILVAAIEDAK